MTAVKILKTWHLDIINRTSISVEYQCSFSFIYRNSMDNKRYRSIDMEAFIVAKTVKEAFNPSAIIKVDSKQVKERIDYYLKIENVPVAPKKNSLVLKLEIKDKKEKKDEDTTKEQEKSKILESRQAVTLRPYNEAANQIWKIYSTVGNAVIIASANSDLVLTVGPKDEYVDGMQALIAWPGNNAPNQKFVFYPDGSIRPADDETMCLSTKTGNITSQDDKLSNLMLLSKAPDILSDSQKFHFVTPLINKD